MVYTVESTSAFASDLRETLDYLNDTLESPQAACNLLTSFEKAVALLEQFPDANAISCKAVLHNGLYREYFLKNYVIVYRIENSRVLLMRLFHQRQFYENSIGNPGF